MATDIVEKVQRMLGTLLADNGFNFEKQVEFPARAQTVVFFQSDLLKIGIYYSWRDGEVNCMLGASDSADANFGTKNGWKYLSALAISADDLTVEQLLALVPLAPQDSDEQLAEIKKNLILLFSKGTDKLKEVICTID